jgi:hypothetical protein
MCGLHLTNPNVYATSRRPLGSARGMAAHGRELGACQETRSIRPGMTWIEDASLDVRTSEPPLIEWFWHGWTNETLSPP